ncbi:MAG: hypothetical protein Q9172_006925 [Xanthocarpia lactea]
MTPPTIAPVLFEEAPGGLGFGEATGGLVVDGGKVVDGGGMELAGDERTEDVDDGEVADKVGREEAEVVEVEVSEAGVALFFLFIAGVRHARPTFTSGGAQAKSPSYGWTRPLGGRPTNTLADTPSGHRPASTDLKHPNSTLLDAAPAYIKAIITPEDKTFPRLDCPAPNGDRYEHLRGPEHTTDGQDLKATLKYFFALDLHKCAHLLPRLLGSIVEAIEFLGPERCALSIVEGRSDDGTFEILLLLREEMDRMGVKYFLQTNEIDPWAAGGDRIKALSELRNQALQPLIDLHLAGDTDVTVVFLNDVAICMEDILELIHQRHRQNADMTCAMDWTYVGRDPTFYDVWIARGMNGDSFFNIPADGNWNSAWNLFWNNPGASERFNAGKPFQVFSCWNGAVAFTAKPVVQQKIKFRRPSDHECHQGEPKSFCKDMWMLGYGKIAVVPSINLEYSDEGAKRIKDAKGYVSRFVAGGDENDKIQWEEKPPEKVKCIPNYENQDWRPWDQNGQNQSAR